MRGQIELRQLRYFLAVAEALHFGKAAAQLGMAQPPLSQQIKTLETIVGYRVFDRTTRGVRLTAVGQYLLERARKTLERVDQDMEMARRLGKGQEGVLSVAFSGSVMFTRLPFVIKRYRRLYPNIELHLQELVTAEQMCALKEGTLDLGFLRDGEPESAVRSNHWSVSDSWPSCQNSIHSPPKRRCAPLICEKSRSFSTRERWALWPSIA
jgi:DNA-binding transcriptional LysR family regulator